jgi:hypothetical protein
MENTKHMAKKTIKQIDPIDVVNEVTYLSDKRYQFLTNDLEVLNWLKIKKIVEAGWLKRPKISKFTNKKIDELESFQLFFLTEEQKIELISNFISKVVVKKERKKK